MTSFLNRQPKKKEEIRRIVNAELLGKFMELKYHEGDLGREIAFPIKKDTEEIWKEKLLRVDCGWEIWEEDSLLPVMQIGEVPLRSCISYRNGPNCDCLLSCFDANKKIIFIKHNGKIVFRAILRLTKGSFVAADERKTIEFVDVTAKSEPHENKAEELVLFLERYYQSGLSEQEIQKAVNLTVMLVKEKAEKLGARLVLSSSYKNVLENKNYVLTNFYMYISASKNGSQYLDSLGGAAGVSASGSYTCNTFAGSRREERRELMNIRRAGRKVVKNLHKEYGIYRIGFVNIYGEEDETELDAMNINDLERLWLSLCPEFECKGNSVCYVERVG